MLIFLVVWEQQYQTNKSINSIKWCKHRNNLSLLCVRFNKRPTLSFCYIILLTMGRIKLLLNPCQCFEVLWWDSSNTWPRILSLRSRVAARRFTGSSHSFLMNVPTQFILILDLTFPLCVLIFFKLLMQWNPSCPAMREQHYTQHNIRSHAIV